MNVDKVDREQSTLKFWEEEYRNPGFAIGDRVSWLNDWTKDRLTGTVVGLETDCFGKGWKYVVVKNEGKFSVKTFLEEELRREKEEIPRVVRMERFARRIKEIAGVEG